MTVCYIIIVWLIIASIIFCIIITMCILLLGGRTLPERNVISLFNLVSEWEFGDEGNFAGKLNQFPRLISHVRSRIYNTRRIPCVYNYEMTCGKRFNIASEIGEEGREGTFRLAAVIKFSKPLLVYLRRTEPQVNLKFAVFGVTSFSPKVINYLPEILNPSDINLDCLSAMVISWINKHCSTL